ncbi:MAG TPA: alpha/beta hydrolase [Bryobacteraceae bacterium]|nr:alpha/beta hydrolase [Bryobacteraceae bacterium]
MLRVPWYVAWPLALAVIYGGLAFLARRSVFYPMKYPGGLWDLQSECRASDVWLQTPDGIRLNAWWAAPAGARLVTLFLHGNAGNVTHRFAVLQEIPAAGSAVLVPDYRGYGRSSGRPTEKGLYTDAETAYEYLLHTGWQPRQIVIQGESLGTAVAIELATRRPCAGLVLEAPFTSAKDVAGTVIPFLGPLLISGFDSRSRIAGVHAPVLFIQGDRDEVIPLRLGQALFKAAPEPKSFWLLHGASHNNIHEVGGAEYIQTLKAFYGTFSAERAPTSQ